MDLDHTESDHILVEWVPTSGSFVDELTLICKRSDRHFFQIILNASDQVLRTRKMMRDGDADTGSANQCDHVDGDIVVALDTTDVAADQVLDAVLDRVGNRWASWTPLRTAALGDSPYRTMSYR